MPLDGARAEKQLRTDLRVRPPVARQPRDMRLLRRQLIARLIDALADLLTRGQQLVPRPLGEPLRPHRQERLARDPQLLARIDAPALAAQPFPVEQPRAGELHPDAGSFEVLDRLAVRRLALARERTDPGLDAECPVAGNVGSVLGDPLERRLQQRRLAARATPPRPARGRRTGCSRGSRARRSAAPQ